MQLAGKKVVFLGDSITEGVGTTEVNGSHEGYRYTDLFAKNTGAEIYNFGISGTRIARQKTPSFYPRHDLYFASRIKDMPEYADVVVVFGGTNDFGHGDAPIGDFNSRDEYTFYGALHNLILKLIEKFPTATIVFLTPLHRLTESFKTDYIGIGNPPSLKNYVDVIKSVCEYYSIPVLDLYAVSGMQPSVEIIRNIYMPDGLHPSDAGAERLARLIEGFLSIL